MHLKLWGALKKLELLYALVSCYVCLTLSKTPACIHIKPDGHMLSMNQLFSFTHSNYQI